MKEEQQIIHYPESFTALKAGVDLVANVVKTTLGPYGKTVIYQTSTGPQITKDGITVARQIKAVDPVENMAVSLLRDIADKTCKEVGDGTTTATVIAQALLNKVIESPDYYLKNVRTLRYDLEAQIKYCIDSLTKTAKNNTVDLEALTAIATISANNDEELGTIIASAVQQVTTSGFVLVKETTKVDTTCTIETGFTFDHGYLSPYFANNLVENNVVFQDALVLLSAVKIKSLESIQTVVEYAYENKKPLLLVVDAIDEVVLSTLVRNRVENGLKVCVVKGPGFGSRRAETLEDLACKIGASVLSTTIDGADEYSIDSLGTCTEIIVSNSKTTLVGGTVNEEILQGRVAQIEHQLKNDDIEDYVEEKLKERLASLRGGVATINVGGNSVVEIKERKDRIDDAVQATQAALRGGYLVGGGISLLRLSEKYIDNTPCGMLLRHALAAPFLQMCENSSLDIAIESILAQPYNVGVNFRTGLIVNLKEEGILVPVEVLTSALKNAASVVSLLLNTGSVITQDPSTNL